MNYTTLQANVASWLHRTDLSSGSPSPIQTFIDQARLRIGGELRSKTNYVVGTVTSFAAGLSALPTNIAQLVSVVDSDGTPLIYFPPNEVDFNHGSGVFSILGEDLYVPDAGSSTVVTLTYYRLPTALSGGTDVSDGMDEWPMLWIAAACRAGAIYCHDFDLADRMEQEYQTWLAVANRSGRDVIQGVAPAVVDSWVNVSATSSGM
jgi:hypothetical protein